MNEDHEHDEDGNCIFPEGYEPQEPVWLFSFWDVAGIVLTTAGAICSSTGSILHQGANLLARECNAMANWKRARFDQYEADLAHQMNQREMAADLERLISPVWDGGEQS